MEQMYQIAINQDVDLHTRYDVIRVMQHMNKKREKLSPDQLKVYKMSLSHRREQLYEILDMTKTQVNSYLYKIRVKGYEAKQIFIKENEHE